MLVCGYMLYNYLTWEHCLRGNVTISLQKSIMLIFSLFINDSNTPNSLAFKQKTSLSQWLLLIRECNNQYTEA